MSNAEEFLANAAECMRMAQATKDERDRNLWIDWAESWVARARNNLREELRNRTPDSAMR